MARVIVYGCIICFVLDRLVCGNGAEGLKFMIEVKNFVERLKNSDVEFFTGVPDSLLKSFCAYVADNCSDGLMRSGRRKTAKSFWR